ncbi:MAG TPA: AIR synthase-related protein, partial [Steroidobacteraceae bacterium]|nr:AIR synthase-related protein [Steroidobacteraceae bacterium]
ALAGSAYAREMAGVVAGLPTLDLEAEAALQRLLVDAAAARFLRSAHDLSSGGLAVTLAECCIAGDIGCTVEGLEPGAAALFGETQSRAVVTCSAGGRDALLALAARHGVPCHVAGAVGGERLRLAGIDVGVADLREAYESGLPRALETAAALV